MAVVFIGWWLGKDVHQLDIVLPGILGFYNAFNVFQDLVTRRWQGGQNNMFDPNQQGPQ